MPALTTAFTPIHTIIGGLLLHLSTSSLLHDTGRVLGISGIVDGALLGDGAAWRWAVVGGLMAGPGVVQMTGLGRLIPDDGTGAWVVQSVPRLGLAGLFVGFGSKLGSGCTSGHFLCGVSRLSPRSLIATAIFFTTAVITANLLPSALYPSDPSIPMSLPSSAQIIPLATPLVIAASIPMLLRIYLLTHRQSSDLRILPYALSGLTFSLGLFISGMVSPLKVISFLRLIPPWTAFDPSLVFIVLGGVVPNAIDWAFTTSKTPRLPWEAWRVPDRKDIDWKLLLGSAVFGVGWGMAGVCPGPAVVALGEAFVRRRPAVMGGIGVWMAGMVVGMFGARRVGS